MVQRHVFDQVDDPRLHALVVWGPMQGGEERGDAVEATRFLDDERTTHFWTGEHTVAARLRDPAGLPEGELAWDTFLLFAPGQRWTEHGPPRPALVMHVGKPLPDEQRLHGPTIRQRALAILASGDD